MSVDSYDYIMTGRSNENSQRISQLEQLCKKRLERIERLERLCARMFRLLEMSAKFPATVSGIEPTRREMQALGLLEVAQ